MSVKLAVVSVGGIGGPLAAFLARAGYDVTIVEQWSANARAIEDEGVHVIVGPREDPEEEFGLHIRTLEVNDVCTINETFDIVFLASKSYDSRWLAQLMEPLLDREGVLVSVQNSLNNEWLAPIVGESRVLACVLFAGGELLSPGRFWRTHPMYKAMYTVGTQDGSITPQLEAVAGVMGDAGVTTMSTNIRGLQWTKVILTTFSAVLSAFLDPVRRTWELAGDPLYRKVAAQLYREGFAVSEAFGVELEPLYGVPSRDLVDSFEDALQGVLEGNSEAHSAGATNMIQHDLVRGRRTEVGYLNGLIVAKGLERGIPTPANTALTGLFGKVEHGELSQHPGNLKLLADAVWS